MQVSDPSVPFNPNPSGPSEIHVCAVHVQILTEFKCQVRMTAPEMRAQVCPLPLLVDAETKFRGAEVRMQIIWQQDAGSLILPLRCSRLKLSYNTKPAASVNRAVCVQQQRAVCLADYRYAQERARKLFGNSGASRKQPALLFITSHFYFSHRDTQQFTPWESSKFSSLQWASIGSSVPTWQNLIGWQWERDVSFEGKPRVKAGRQIMGVFLFCGIMFIWNIILITKDFSCHT